MYEGGRVSSGKVANVSLPPRGRVVSEPGHTEARRQERERERKRRSSLFQDRHPEFDDGCVCVGRDGMYGAQGREGGVHDCAPSMSFPCLWLNIAGGSSQLAKQICYLPSGCVWNTSLEQNMCVYGGCTCVGAFLVSICMCVHKEVKRKKGFQHFRDMGSDLLL